MILFTVGYFSHLMLELSYLTEGPAGEELFEFDSIIL